MKNLIKFDRESIAKFLAWTVALLALFYFGPACADDGGSAVGIAKVASNIQNTFKDVAQLITAGAYIAGMGFGVGAILKFKAHKDNPSQIPVGTPIALLFIAAALLFMPSIFSVAGGTLFGGSGTQGGITGVTTF